MIIEEINLIFFLILIINLRNNQIYLLLFYFLITNFNKKIFHLKLIIIIRIIQKYFQIIFLY